MGYESNLYITQAPLLNEDGRPGGIYYGAAFCARIAEIDLCKVGYDGPVAKLIRAAINAEKARIEAQGWRYGIYECADGDSLHTEDKYGEPLSPVPLGMLIDAIEQQNRSEPYRRFDVALAMLHALDDQVAQGVWGTGVVVLHYGH